MYVIELLQLAVAPKLGSYVNTPCSPYRCVTSSTFGPRVGTRTGSATAVFESGSMSLNCLSVMRVPARKTPRPRNGQSGAELGRRFRACRPADDRATRRLQYSSACRRRAAEVESTEAGSTRMGSAGTARSMLGRSARGLLAV